MDSVKRIKSAHKELRAKALYFRSYLEHIEAMSSKSSDLLFRAAQIPRDVAWSDPHIIYCIEMGDRQRALFDSAGTRYSQELVRELDWLCSYVTEGLRTIDEEVSKVFGKASTGLDGLKTARERHLDAWMRGKCDPWVTENRLRCAIRCVLHSDDEANSIMQYKVGDFQSALNKATEAFSRIIQSFVRIQKDLFGSINDVLGTEAVSYVEADRYYDAIDEERAGDGGCRAIERMQTTFDSLIEGMSRDAEKSGVTVKRNLEISASGICLFKRGYTGDWVIAMALVTSTRYVHLIDLTSTIEEYKDYKSLIWKLKCHRDRGLISLFDSRKYKITFKDEELLKELNAILRHEIEALIGNIVFSCRINERIFTLEKDRCTVAIDSNGQLGFFLRIGVIKVRFMVQRDAKGFFASLSEAEMVDKPAACEYELTEAGDSGTSALRIVPDETNPWKEESKE
jgi:hypothetical protein